MKKNFLTLFGTGAIFLALASGAYALVEKPLLTAVADPEAPAASAEATALAGPQTFNALTAPTINAATLHADEAQLPQGARRVAINSVADLKGSYVQTYKPLTTSGFEGGCGVTITPVEGKDSVTITNFWTNNNPPLVAKAKVDIAKKTISIPNQVLYTHSTYGKMDLALCGSDGKPNRKANIEGRILDDGSIVLDSWWGVYVVAGTEKDKFVTANYNTVYERANATMSYQVESNGQTMTNTYPVVATTPQSNVVAVKNFFNAGLAAEIVLNADRTGTIASQHVMNNNSGEWVTIGNLQFEDGKLKGYTPVIRTQAAAAGDNRTIRWTNWSVLTTGLYAGQMLNTVLTLSEDLTYPVNKVTSLEGEGTAANPFKIKSLDDLIYVANEVNGSQDLSWTTPPLKTPYARVFLGKHFELSNDIDMGGYRFTPIGQDWSHFFAGSLDGKGHTIKNLTVNTGANGYAGLFGRTDTTSVLKNIVFEKPVIETSGNNGAPLAAWSLGTIENVTVNEPMINVTGQCAAGLVGIAQTVRNCKVVNPTINALGGFGGGLAGEIDRLIENCSVTGLRMICASSVKGSPFGGLVASLYFSDMKNCYATGIVNANAMRVECTSGGVAGILYYGTMENCFFAGTVSGYSSESIQGGVAGNHYGHMINCHATGHIYGYSSRYTGGLSGYVRTPTDNRPDASAKNCYAAMSMEAETYQYNPETETREIFGKIQDESRFKAENCYFDSQLNNFGTTRFGATTAELTAAAGPKGFNSADWTFRAGFYPVLKTHASTEAANYAASALVLDASSNIRKVQKNARLNKLGDTRFLLLVNGRGSAEGKNASIVGDSLKLKGTFGTDTLVIENGRSQSYHVLNIAPAYFKGEGTAENPYLIETKQDLITLSHVTTDIKQLYPDTYFKMTNDIDLEYDMAFKGICGDAADAHNQFEGHFDGAGHTIHRMKIATMVWTVKPSASNNWFGTPKTGNGGSTAYTGFIGRLEAKGSLKNLNMAADCDLKETWATSGAFVGTNNGLVENCRNYADVTAYSCWVGGIAGQSSKGSVIRNCYNAGTITTGYADAGGIAGQALGTIENCANAGDIRIISISNFQKPTDTKFKRGGGIFGGSYGGTFKNLLNVGTVVTLSGYAGGIAGNLPLASTSGSGLNTMHSVVNYGQVYGNDLQYVGAIAGGTGSQGETAGVYYDAQITQWGAYENSTHEGVTGITTEELLSGKAPAGIDTEAWIFEKGKYPVLKLFADEPKLQAARQIIVRMPAGTTAADMMKDATLDQPQGIKWTLAKAEVFKLEGNTVKAPASVQSLVTDTIKAEFQGLLKPIAIQAKPACPLKGAGTEKDPYQIGSTDDWRAVVKWMNSINDGLQGRFLKITADIDFKGMEDFEPMCSNGTTFLKGTLDGGGHTLKNVWFVNSATYQGGLFGVIDRTGTVKNLTVGGVVEGSKTYLGGIVGKLYGTLDNVVSELKVRSSVGSVGGFVAMAYTGARLTKCVNKGAVEGVGANIGGLMAQAEGGITFTECGNEGTVTQKATSAVKYTAGILGVSNNPSTFVKCYNKGTISATSHDTNKHPSCFAGLVAYCNAGKEQAEYVFTDCWNEGEVKGAAMVGGLTADVNTTAGNTRFNMTRCYNKGTVASISTAAISSAYTGGVSAVYPAGSTYTDCWNEGEVSSAKNVYAGGIAGYYKPTATAAFKCVFKGCHNSGKIIANGNQGGGITASSSSYTTIEGCWNEGEITGGFILGGITGGQLGTENVIRNCWNSGKVTTSTNRAGGISAQYTSATGLIEGCFNFGEISSTSETMGTTNTSGYGIGGIVANCGGPVKNCYNLGNLKGACIVGGIAGQISKNNTKIENCYTTGRITAPEDTCGNIVGENTANGKKWDATKNYVKNCYYLDEVEVKKPNNPEGTKITMAELVKKEMGEGWFKYDDHSMPVIAAHKDLDAAKLYAVHYTLAEGETPALVKSDFMVSQPEGVSWTSSLAELSVSGGKAKFNKTVKGDLKLTAQCGKYSKEFNFKVDAKVVGIDNVYGDKEVESEAWFTAAGIATAKPEAGDGQVYIVRLRFTDGTTATRKVLNR